MGRSFAACRSPVRRPGPGADGTNGVDGADGADGVGLDLTGSDGDLLVWEVDNWVANPPEVAVMGVDNMQPFQVINYIIALQGVFPSRNGIEPFIGEIIMFAGNFAPRGWAFCDGQLLPINQNQSLFSILGTTYGGDGRTNFGLPDLRGRAPIHDGFGMGDGLMDRRLGVKGGTETH